MFEAERRRMVDEQLKARGIRDERVLAAFLNVPRHLFVPEALHMEAYADHAVPIGSGQTISQPYIVAAMTQALRLQGHERVLEIGTGSGYQLAILAELALEVYSVERLPQLASQATARLERLGYLNVRMRMANGSLGWPEQAPFEGIAVTAAAPEIPEPLVEQLADGGRMVIPIGSQQAQALVVAERHGNQLHTQELAGCVFVPLIGQYGWSESP